ncbi:MAG: hypothetical protein J6B36_03860 [Muribaculaceae bacterium]|nr:hypothetical protein [Muribaculaceae bacterium]
MHSIKLTINGKTKYMPIQLTPEQEQMVELYTEALTTKADLTGWEKPETGEYGFYEDEDGTVTSIECNEMTQDKVDNLYNSARIYSNSGIAAHSIRIQLLLRKLRRFAATHRTKPFDPKRGGYTIMYNYIDECIECGLTGPYLALGDIIFETEELAQEAIALYAEDLLWYFKHTRERLWTNQ